VLARGLATVPFASVTSVAVAMVLVGSLVGCAAPSRGPDAHGRLRLVAAFYPLQWVTERVAGQPVRSLTRPGVEPHDLELTPRDVGAVYDADLVVYLSGFQPSVDQAVRTEAKGRHLDVRPTARLDLRATAERAGTADPHFWLDPTRLADVADAIAQRLAAIDPARASTYLDNARAVDADLTALDRDLRRGLASCRGTDLVTSHAAFGYLARRYGLHQVGVTGIDPEAEPSPADLARVARLVRERGVRTVYAETLVSPAVARTVATETGARTAVLDPVEGLSDASRGDDYVAVVRSDLATLRRGQPCP